MCICCWGSHCDVYQHLHWGVAHNIRKTSHFDKPLTRPNVLKGIDCCSLGFIHSVDLSILIGDIAVETGRISVTFGQKSSL